MRIIEIGGHTKDPVGKRLSNFHARPFVFDGVQCAGFEGFIQSLKCPDIARQREMCGLTGKDAKRIGKPFDTWKRNQQLHWNGTLYHRVSRDYMLLITRVYDEIYAQDPTLRDDLLALEDAVIWHSIGNPDMRDTTLTEAEMLFQLERLRHRALREGLSGLMRPLLKF